MNLLGRAEQPQGAEQGYETAAVVRPGGGSLGEQRVGAGLCGLPTDPADQDSHPSRQHQDMPAAAGPPTEQACVSQAGGICPHLRGCVMCITGSSAPTRQRR